MVVPNVLLRSKNLIDLTIPVSPGVEAYRLKGSRNLNDAFGTAGGVVGAGADLLFDVLTRSYFRSPSIERRNAGVVEESFRDLTRIIFDLEDYQGPGNNLPLDNEILFLRTLEKHVATGAFPGTDEGPILVVPPRGFFGLKKPGLTLSGSAPGLQGMRGMFPPAGSMHLVLPAYAESITIMNLNPTNSLLISFGQGMPLMEITGLSSISPDGEFGEIFIVSPLNGSAVDFSIFAEIVNFG